MPSRILIFIRPGFRIPDPESRIPDPTTAAKEEGGNFSCFTFFSHKLNLKIILFLNRYRKKNLSQLTKNYFYPEKFSLSSQKYGLGIRDLGSRKKPILDPGVKKHGSLIRILYW
jgi:hypothetical protein